MKFHDARPEEMARLPFHAIDSLIEIGKRHPSIKLVVSDDRLFYIYDNESDSLFACWGKLVRFKPNADATEASQWVRCDNEGNFLPSQIMELDYANLRG